MRKIFLAFSAFAALAGCDRNAADDDAVVATPASEIREVAAADGYGEDGAKVTDIAFWSHPNVNFASLVLATTENGLATFNVELGDPGASVEIAGAKGVDVAYLGRGPAAQGLAIVETADDGFRFYAIDNASMDLWLRPTLMVAGAGDGFCAGASADATALALHHLDGKNITTYTLRASDAGVSAVSSVKSALPRESAHCAVDGRTGDVHFLDKNGAIYVLAAAGGQPRKIAETGIRDGADLAAFPMKSGAEGDQPCCFRLAVLNAADGVIYLFDGDDGHALGAVRIKSTFDLPAITTANALGAGPGNYGGVFRDGVLAVATETGAPIRLVAWNGVIDALELELGEVVEPRPAYAADAEPDVISIEFIEP
jgi:hypothetical protein